MSKKVDVNRRAFLRGAYLTREGRAEVSQQQNPLGPAPPWHQGLPLQSHCPGCTQPCVAACEPAIIRIHPQHHSHAGVPYLGFASAGCTFCHACVEACPIDIDASNEPVPRIGELILDRATCIAWKDIICMSCSSRCPHQAIKTRHHRRPLVDDDACTTCGICIAACPVQSLRITSLGPGP